MSVYKITDSFFISGQISPANISAIAEMGFKSIICNRPDGEAMMQPAFSKIEKAANEAGLATKYLPVSPGPANINDAEDMRLALAQLEGPVLAYCASGNRSANLWNLCESINNNNTKRSAA